MVCGTIFDTLVKVIYVNEEEYWSKNTALGHSMREGFTVRFKAINDYFLFSVGKIRSEPIIDYTSKP